MNYYLKNRLKSIQGMAFGSVQDDAAEAWAIEDALLDVVNWYRGKEPDKVLHRALNALEDMRGGTKVRQLTDDVRYCLMYEDQYRTLLFKRTFPVLRDYMKYKGTIRSRY